MHFNPSYIPGSFEITLSPREDERGIFTRLFCLEEFSAIGHYKNIVQVNNSVNHRIGTIRGMHFQRPPHEEVKIIRCIKGRIFDVLVDVRKSSPTFLKWHAVELSASKNNMIYIPEGIAHGFQVLERDSELLYFHTQYYHPESEGALRYDDPLLGIKWPKKPVNVSDKDKSYRLINEEFTGL